MHNGASCVHGNDVFKLSVKGSGDINQGMVSRHAFGTLNGDAGLGTLSLGTALVQKRDRSWSRHFPSASLRDGTQSLTCDASRSFLYLFVRAWFDCRTFWPSPDWWAHH